MMDLCISRRAALTGLMAAAIFPSRSALAQQYPTRPITWLVGYAAGGGTDVLARLLGSAMTSHLGQPIVIENRPGAATNIAAEAAARAEPDGYKIFTAAVETLVYNPALYKKLPSILSATSVRSDRGALSYAPYGQAATPQRRARASSSSGRRRTRAELITARLGSARRTTSRWSG